jgi:hypothetical protein
MERLLSSAVAFPEVNMSKENPTGRPATADGLEVDQPDRPAVEGPIEKEQRSTPPSEDDLERWHKTSTK